MSSTSSSVPRTRIRTLLDVPENPQKSYVLYWMIAARRTRHNFALQHAADRAQALGLPLLVLEPLRIDYPWACDRFHRFVIDGMRDNAKALESTTASYYPYVEPALGASKGMIAAFAKLAALVVSDDAPFFFFPKMQRAAAAQLSARFEAVDSNGMYPIRETQRVFTTAASFRRHLQKELPAHIADLPDQDTLARRHLPPLPALPRSLSSKWPRADLAASDELIAGLAIDHEVSAVPTRGGSRAGAAVMRRFVKLHLADYASKRNQPSADCQSHLSPYLHFGQVAASEVFTSITSREAWTPGHLADHVTGSRTGWWGMSEESEAFIDQLITWRELGLNAATNDADYTEYKSLPTWAKTTLEEHSGDPRPALYTHDALEAACTHDEIWNAAQRQLRREGQIHNYLRMLWGKKILEWSPTPTHALRSMVELNNKYALDGRDPNSYSGIFWTLGRYDRAWGERKIFGKVRYMSSDNTARKLQLKGYLETYAAS